MFYGNEKKEQEKSNRINKKKSTYRPTDLIFPLEGNTTLFLVLRCFLICEEARLNMTEISYCTVKHFKFANTLFREWSAVICAGI